MTRRLYELVGADLQRPFSPACWRSRVAPAHKGLAAESVPWRFTQTEGIAALSAGKTINYDGASSSVEFKADGALSSRDFELYEIRNGRDVSVERITSTG
jgi:hypothetical protein